MTDSLFAGYLCATHVGAELLMVGEDTIPTKDNRWKIHEIRYLSSAPTVKLILHPIREDMRFTRSLTLQPDAIITLNVGI